MVLNAWLECFLRSNKSSWYVSRGGRGKGRGRGRGRGRNEPFNVLEELLF